MRTLLSIACLAALLAAPRPADACSCNEPGPPCEIFWRYDAVFTGKVVAARDVARGIGMPTEGTFEVLEDFTGNVGRRVVVGGSVMCGYRFEKGEQYFVYATRDGAGYTTSACSGTKPLAEAPADLAYARNRPKRKLAVIEGTVQIESGVDARGQEQNLPRANAVVSVSGTPISARTGKDGSYRLEVPPGSYTLDVTDQGARVRAAEPVPAVSLSAGAACARRDILEVWDGRIRGRLVDHTGQPAVDVRVAAYATAGTHQRWRLDAKTDVAGDYEIREVPEGSFIVAVNNPSDFGPHEGVPIPPTFYPGVGTEAKARAVALKPGGLATKIDFQLRAPLAVYTISGVVKRRGAPVPKVYVKRRNFTWPHSDGQETDAAGAFTFREVAGSEVTLEICRRDADPSSSRTACTQQKRRITGDITVNLEMPR